MFVIRPAISLCGDSIFLFCFVLVFSFFYSNGGKSFILFLHISLVNTWANILSVSLALSITSTHTTNIHMQSTVRDSNSSHMSAINNTNMKTRKITATTTTKSTTTQYDRWNGKWFSYGSFFFLLLYIS